MANKRDRNNSPWGVIAGVALALIITGTGAAWFTIHKLTSSNSNPDLTPQTPLPVTPTVPSPTSPTPQATVTPQPPTQPQETVQVYWLKFTETQTQLQPVFIPLQKSADKSETLKLAFENLLGTPQDSTYVTAIPQGTKLLSLKVDEKGVHVNLSQQFTTEQGASGMIGRLAQVIYTATSLDPQTQVWIDIEGKPLELLGEGDGIEVDQPMTRKLFEDNFDL